ncbi:MAG TPA: hypothetical protein VF758_03590, partial [Candidatus Acidoferrum sp.]
MNGQNNHRVSLWRSLSKLDWLAIALAVGGIWAGYASAAQQALPGMGLLRFVGLIAIFYLLYRFWSHWRTHLLWSLRNRLIVAYLFIAVVPIILIVILASLSAQIIYSQLGAYLLYHEVEDRIGILADSGAHIAAAEVALPASMDEKTLDAAIARQITIAEGKLLPGLVVNFDAAPADFQRLAGTGSQSFSGLVQTGTQLELVALR